MDFFNSLLACCASSFVLLSIYEAAAVRVVIGRSMTRVAFVTGLIANSIGHVVGAAALSGTALRVRRYGEYGIRAVDAGAIALLSNMPYLLAAGWLLDISLLAYPAVAARALQVPQWVIITAATIGLAKDVGWLLFVWRLRVLRIRSWSLQLPSLRVTFVQLVVGASEILSVVAILFVFMPDELALDFAAFTGLFLIAAFAAQLSHVPAGLGVLEAALLLMLPQVPPSKLLAAVLCYRIVFELLPLIPGLVLLLSSELRRARRAVLSQNSA